MLGATAVFGRVLAICLVLVGAEGGREPSKDEGALSLLMPFSETFPSISSLLLLLCEEELFAFVDPFSVAHLHIHLHICSLILTHIHTHSYAYSFQMILLFSARHIQMAKSAHQSLGIMSKQTLSQNSNSKIPRTDA